MSAIDEVFAPYPEHLTAHQVAEALGVGSSTVYAWLRTGRLPSYRVGGMWIIFRDEVLVWVKGGRKCTEFSVIDDVLGRYPDRMSVQNVAEALGIAPNTVYRFLADKTLPAFRRAGTWLILRDDLLEWMKEGRTPLRGDAQD